MVRAADPVPVNDRQAVLLTGIYGVGKSSTAAEIAYLLEGRRIGYAMLDLDYLHWFDTGRDDGSGGEEMLRANVSAVIRNYVSAGIRRYVVAGTVADAAGRDRLAETLDMPLRVVRLTAPFDEIERRLRSDVTTGRANDLRESRAQLERGESVGIEDISVANDRPIRRVAAGVLDWLGWADDTADA